MRPMLQDVIWNYVFIHQRLTEAEHPVLRADRWFEWSSKAGFVLYGLRDLIGDSTMNVALKEFLNTWAFRSHGPYAGTNDLYATLKRHVPDSLMYYLTDTWEKVTLYDNKVLSASAVKTDRPDEYEVTMRVSVDKYYKNDNGDHVDATDMNDYIDIGVMGDDAAGSSGRMRRNFLYLQKVKLTKGEHVLKVLVHGVPKAVGIDPIGLLVEQRYDDNLLPLGK